MAFKFELGGKLVEPAMVIVATLLLTLSLVVMINEPHASSKYVNFYTGLGKIGTLSSLFIAGFFIKFFDPNPINNFPDSLKWGAVIIFFLIIGFATLSGLQITHVPKASTKSFQMSKSTELYTSSVIPGFLEDLVFLFNLPILYMIVMSIALKYIFGVQIGALEYTVMAVIASCLAALGLGVWLLPGFSSAHIPRYGTASNQIIGLFLFGWAQSFIYLMTGIFFPVAHILHNYVVTSRAIFGMVLFPFVMVAGSIFSNLNFKKLLFNIKKEVKKSI